MRRLDILQHELSVSRRAEVVRWLEDAQHTDDGCIVLMALTLALTHIERLDEVSKWLPSKAAEADEAFGVAYTKYCALRQRVRLPDGVDTVAELWRADRGLRNDDDG